jgi:SAM-dependent methyltransferase
MPRVALPNRQPTDSSEDLSRFFDGSALYGDDFGPDAIQSWYDDEAEGYAELLATESNLYAYGYHALNHQLGFRHLPRQRFPRVLGFGSAYGDELLPVLSGVDRVTIVDPSDAFVRERVHGKLASYVKPTPDGRLPLLDASFDLATCLGVLHHIPNVSFVTKELSRVLAPGGYLLLREPIVSMGDWREPRRGLTRRERGIPIESLKKIVANCGLQVIKSSLCAFPLTPRLFGRSAAGPYNNRWAVQVDSLLSRAFAWNINYHPRNTLQRLRPTSVFFVLQKPSS